MYKALPRIGAEIGMWSDGSGEMDKKIIKMKKLWPVMNLASWTKPVYINLVSVLHLQCTVHLQIVCMVECSYNYPTLEDDLYSVCAG